jgi:hypothetical protein
MPYDDEGQNLQINTTPLEAFAASSLGLNLLLHATFSVSLGIFFLSFSR